MYERAEMEIIIEELENIVTLSSYTEGETDVPGVDGGIDGDDVW